MAKNNKLVWIIIIVVILIFASTLIPKKTAFVKDNYATLSACETARSSYISSGSYVSVCAQWTADIEACSASWRSGTASGRAIGSYVFLQESDMTIAQACYDAAYYVPPKYTSYISLYKCVPQYNVYDPGAGCNVIGCPMGQTCSGGTCVTACTVTSWSPDVSTKCNGETFTQTSNCGTTQTATGTATPQADALNSIGSWKTSPSSTTMNTALGKIATWKTKGC